MGEEIAIHLGQVTPYENAKLLNQLHVAPIYQPFQLFMSSRCINR